MKIAVLSDVHANLPALQRVIADIDDWNPDEVIAAGDLVNRGPRPAECLALVQQRMQSDGWHWVRGNHEDYVLKMANGIPSGPEREVHRASLWTYQQLGGDVSPLLAMPFQYSLTGPDGREVRIVHASMRHNRDGIYPETSDPELRTKLTHPDKEGRPPAVLCVGHTHRPLVRRLERTLVVNAGSAGLPFDHDPRPSYARLTYTRGQWQAEIVRLEYNRAQAEADFFTSGYIPGGGPLVELVLIELREARSQLYGWAVRYQQMALAGQITMRASVDRYLNGENG